ncbi:hypothetical protein DA075_22690 [Methylobacterium currus]|uniref:DUF308 domain-containing protein n=1 Tax=Methylobacterium currus TaxID=2051553 RepID=A0A2R4WU13_9HYPH|nr:hypothetical protein DA075_22690 [Methylobacterium currus]
MTVLALLMLIGGVAAMVQGIPFVRLEVGWTMVIAGTVGASGGAMLLGITAAVARLARIERALTERAPAARGVAEQTFVDPAPAEVGAAPVRASRSEPVMPPILPPIAFPPAPEPRPAGPTGFDGGAALAAGTTVAAAGLAASELRLTRAEDRDLPAKGPEASRHEPMPQEPISQEPLSQEPLLHEPAHHEPLPLPAEDPRSDAGGMHDAAAPPPPPAPPAPEPAPPMPEPVAEAPRPEEPPHEELPLEEPPGKTVIGTYDSGGNTYTMYADGTIDAETPAGRFHFASIEELKAFRGAGGEGAARGA